MNSKERLTALCTEAIQARQMDDRYLKRLKDELREIDAQNEFEYFLDLYDRRIRYPINQNNLLVPNLLGVVDDFVINDDPVFTYGEFPDIDIDYIDVIRDYLKNVWAPEEFGFERVCNIGTYAIFGIKSAFQDMARVHSQSHSEIVDLTTKLGLKDDEGKALTFNKALEIYPELKKYCDEHPDVAKAVSKLLHRNRGMSKHAGGLIIAREALDKFVPLVKNIKDNTISSAWTEGLNAQDLGPVGLIKFDLLVIKDLERIAVASSLVKKRHGLDTMCALPGQPDWSDRSYKNDEKAIAMADEGDLVGVFQFDSEQIRAMVRRGGVQNFDDLVAYNALYRPGPLNMKMHERYIERKRGREAFELHPLMEPYLAKTYGVLVFQEQLMQILNAVGDIPLKDCYIVIKAVAKKKIKLFGPYKEKFLVNGQKNLGWSYEKVLDLWNQIESFAEYGFNKSMTEDTIIHTSRGPQELRDVVPGDKVWAVDELGRTVQTDVVALHDHGNMQGYEVTFSDGYKVICTPEHKFLTLEGQVPLRRIVAGDISVLCVPGEDGGYVESEAGRLADKVRYSFSHTAGILRSLPAMPGVPTAELEGGEPYSQVRAGVHDLGTKGNSPEGLLCLQGPQEAEYRLSYGQAEQGQRGAVEKGDFFLDGEDHICQAGNPGSKGRSPEKLAIGEPRQVCGLHFGSTAEFQAIQDGGVAQSQIGLGWLLYPLWGGSQTGGLGERHDLGGSGRTSSFQRALPEDVEETAERSGPGRHAESGSFSTWQYYAFSSEHGVFRFLDGGDEVGLVGHVSEHAPITDTGRLVPRRVVRVVPVGLRRMYDLEVATPTHNFLLPNGVVTSNSHACAYCYISARCLKLKAHYPLEFYAATLRCETVTEKLKEYKAEAERHGVPVHPVKLNKSKEKFDIVDDEIYFGFSNIKGIGDAVAERIVKGQPYAGFQDFLERFGTDATVIKPLVALRVFKDADPVTLYKYYEFFKDRSKKRRERKKRFVRSAEKMHDKLRKLLTPKFEKYAKFTDAHFEKWKKIFNKDEIIEVEKEVEETLFADDSGMEPMTIKKTVKIQKKFNRWKELKKLRALYDRSVRGDQNKSIAEQENRLSLTSFQPDDWTLDDDIILELRDAKECERQHYGFLWRTRLEESPDYTGGRTFDWFKAEVEAGAGVRSVEVEIEEVQELRSKKNKEFVFHQLVVSDANGQKGYITVWKEDFERWEPEMKKGNLVKIRIMPPSPPYKKYTFESPPRHQRHRIPRDKRQDNRLLVMQPPPEEEGPKPLTDREIMDQLSNCKME